MSEAKEDMQLLFIHGWGMNSTIWHSTIDKLPKQDCKTIDLGFVQAGENQPFEKSKPTIVIAHSLGTLWFLKNYQNGVGESELNKLNLKAFISIGGFTNFSSFTPLATLNKMKEGIRENPAAQMALFWRRAGCKNFASPENLNSEKLNEGLEWLASWNASEEASNLSCPKLILSSKADKIVPGNATVEQWQGEAGKKNNQIIWHETAPHCLQLVEPEWVAEKIIKQAQAL